MWLAESIAASSHIFSCETDIAATVAKVLVTATNTFSAKSCLAAAVKSFLPLRYNKELADCAVECQSRRFCLDVTVRTDRDVAS